MLKTLCLAALALCGLAPGAFAASCDNSGLVVNGFEGVGSVCGTANDITLWSVAGAGATLSPITQGVNTHFVVDGSQYGRLQWPLTDTQVTLTMNGPFVMGANWTGYDFIHVAYATTNTAAGNYSTAIYLNSAASGNVQFMSDSTNLARPSGWLVPVTGWVYALVSLNYARNLGMDLSSMASVSVEQNNPTPPGLGNGNIAYDYMRLNIGGATPNNPVPDTQLTATAGCGNFVLSWPAQSQTGSEPIFGYHVYRATTATGPWVSTDYVLSPGLSYTELSPAAPTEYFIVLPYSTSTTSFGSGNQGYYTGCGNTSFDPAWIAGDGGVHEAALAAATPAAFNANSGCTATPTYTVPPSPTPSPTITPTFSASPTFSVSPTISETANGTFTISPTITPTAPGTFTETPTFSVTYTPTISATFTLTPTYPPAPGTQIYPNPFNPDKGEVFHIGNIQAGDVMSIYNIIGEMVYTVKLKGNPSLDVWDGLNNNGVKVVTGVYFLVLSGSVNQIFRVAVVRENK